MVLSPRGGSHFSFFFVRCIFVVEKEAVDTDDGKMPVKDSLVVISLDDLMTEKIGGQSIHLSTTSTAKVDVFKGNF